jgi:hypothetical protein
MKDFQTISVIAAPINAARQARRRLKLRWQVRASYNRTNPAVVADFCPESGYDSFSWLLGLAA